MNKKLYTKYYGRENLSVFYGFDDDHTLYMVDIQKGKIIEKYYLGDDFTGALEGISASPNNQYLAFFGQWDNSAGHEREAGLNRVRGRPRVEKEVALVDRNTKKIMRISQFLDDPAYTYTTNTYSIKPPFWLDDHTLLYANYTGQKSGLVVLDLHNYQVKSYHQGFLRPFIAPTGNKIGFLGKNNDPDNPYDPLIYIYYSQLTREPEKISQFGEKYIHQLSFSPEADKVAYIQEDVQLGIIDLGQDKHYYPFPELCLASLPDINWLDNHKILAIECRKEVAEDTVASYYEKLILINLKDQEIKTILDFPEGPPWLWDFALSSDKEVLTAITRDGLLIAKVHRLIHPTLMDKLRMLLGLERIKSLDYLYKYTK